MWPQLFGILGRFCLALLLLCVVFHAMYLAMAYVVQLTTDPPKCQVAFAFPLPFASCPKFGFPPDLDYALALPGAILAFPFVLPGLITDTGSSLQPFVLLPTVLHVFGWGYLLTLLISKGAKIGS